MPHLTSFRTLHRAGHLRSSRRIRRSSAIAFAASLAVLAIAIAAVTLRSARVESEPPPVAAAPGDDWAHEGISRDRADYRYSVIPGGAFNERELRRAIATDPVVAAHYAQLDQSRIRVEIVPRDRFVHVSYRKGNQVFWTKKKLLIRRGETILTDGTTQIRARCGNCISETPIAPAAQEEPDIIEFDRLTDNAPELRSGTIAVGFGQPAAPKPMPLSGGADVAPVQQVAESHRPIAGGVAPSAATGHFAGGGVPLVRPTPTGTDPSQFASGLGSPPRLPSPAKTSPAVDVTPPPGLLFPGVEFGSSNDGSFLRPDGSTLPLDEIVLGSGNPGGSSNPGGSGDPAGSGDPDVAVTIDSIELPLEPANPVPVPEPGTLLMVGAGVAALVRRLRARAGTRNPAL